MVISDNKIPIYRTPPSPRRLHPTPVRPSRFIICLSSASSRSHRMHRNNAPVFIDNAKHLFYSAANERARLRAIVRSRIVLSRGLSLGFSREISPLSNPYHRVSARFNLFIPLTGVSFSVRGETFSPELYPSSSTKDRSDSVPIF